MPWQKEFDIEATLGRAMDAFWERGYSATSLQDLVERTGVNRASLYATWGDKHSLFIAALERYEDKVRRALFTELETRYGPKEAIRRLFERNASIVASRRARRGCFVTNTALELAPHDSEVASLVARQQREIEGFFRRMILRAQEAGEVPLRVDAEIAAKGLMASMLGLLVLARSRPDSALLEQVATEALKRLD